MLRVQVFMPVSQSLTGVTEQAFRADRNAAVVLQRSIQTAIKNTEARITIDNLQQRYVNVTVSDFPMSLRAVNLVSVLVVNFTLQFYAADMAPRANASRATQIAATRLEKTLNAGQLTDIIQKESVVLGSVLQTAVSDSGALSIGQSRAVFVQSTLPSSQPTSQPSHQPSKQPTSQPSNSPSLSVDSQWRQKLLDELGKYDTQRNSRTFYTMLLVEDRLLYGGEEDWEQFVLFTNVALQSRYLDKVTVLAANDTHSVEAVCRETSALHDIASALMSNATVEIFCDAYWWKIGYCADNLPHLCVSCPDPCSSLPAVLPVADSSHLQFMVFHTIAEHETGLAFVWTFVALWGVIVMLCIWKTCCSPQRIHSIWNIQQDIGQWQLKRAFNIAAVAQDDVLQAVDALFAYCASPSGAHAVIAVVSKHRDFRWLDLGPHHAVYAVSHMVGCVVCTLGLLSWQYPYDDGECSQQTTRQACEDRRSTLLTSRHICQWIDTLPTDALLPDPNAFTSSCYWLDDSISAYDAFRLAAVAIAVIVPMRVIVLERLIKWATADVEELPAVPTVPMYVPMSSPKVAPQPSTPSSSIKVAAHNIDPVDYYRYEWELRSPTPSAVRSALVPRHPKHCFEDAFAQFFTALIAYRDALPVAEQAAFNAQWALQGTAFNADLVIQRDILWQLRHFPSVAYQTPSDYLVEYVQKVSHQIANHSNASPSALLCSFALDLLGLNTLECQIFARRSYRWLHPRTVSAKLRAFSVMTLLAGNGGLIFLDWYWIHQRSSSDWEHCLWVVLFLDLLLVENVDNVWGYWLIPALCRTRTEEVKAEIVETAAHGGKAAGFDAAHHLFASRQLAKSAQAGLIGEMVSSYRLPSPERIVGPWLPNLDLVHFPACRRIDLSACCKTIACFPAIAQRMFLLIVLVGLMFIVSLAGHDMEYAAMEYFALCVLCVFGVLVIGCWAYGRSERVKIFVDKRLGGAATASLTHGQGQGKDVEAA